MTLDSIYDLNMIEPSTPTLEEFVNGLRISDQRILSLDNNPVHLFHHRGSPDSRLGIAGVTSDKIAVIGINLDRLDQVVETGREKELISFVETHELVHIVNKTLLVNMSPRDRQNFINRLSLLGQHLNRTYEDQFIAHTLSNGGDRLTAMLDESLSTILPFLLNTVPVRDRANMFNADAREKIEPLFTVVERVLEQDPKLSSELLELYSPYFNPDPLTSN